MVMYSDDDGVHDEKKTQMTRNITSVASACQRSRDGGVLRSAHQKEESRETAPPLAPAVQATRRARSLGNLCRSADVERGVDALRHGLVLSDEVFDEEALGAGLRGVGEAAALLHGGPFAGDDLECLLAVLC